MSYRTEFFHGIRLPNCLINLRIALQAWQDAINQESHLHEMLLNSEILNSLKVIDDQTLLAVENHHNTKKINGKPIGQLLVHMGIIEAEVLTRALCIQSGVPMVDLLSINIPYDILDRIPIEKAHEKKVVPVGVYNKTL